MAEKKIGFYFLVFFFKPLFGGEIGLLELAYRGPFCMESFIPLGLPRPERPLAPGDLPAHFKIAQDSITFPETNSNFAPENGWLVQMQVSFGAGPGPIFAGDFLLVSGRKGLS